LNPCPLIGGGKKKKEKQKFPSWVRRGTGGGSKIRKYKIKNTTP